LLYFVIFSPTIGDELDPWIISPGTCAPTRPTPNAASGVWNGDVMERLETVLETIHEALHCDDIDGRRD